MRRHTTMSRTMERTKRVMGGFALATLLTAGGPRAAQAQILEGLVAGAVVGGIMGAALYVWKPPADHPGGPAATSFEDGAGSPRLAVVEPGEEHEGFDAKTLRPDDDDDDGE